MCSGGHGRFYAHTPMPAKGSTYAHDRWRSHHLGCDRDASESPSAGRVAGRPLRLDKRTMARGAPCLASIVVSVWPHVRGTLETESEPIGGGPFPGVSTGAEEVHSRSQCLCKAAQTTVATPVRLMEKPFPPALTVVHRPEPCINTRSPNVRSAIARRSRTLSDAPHQFTGTLRGSAIFSSSPWS
jgi:hypothetical protein